MRQDCSLNLPHMMHSCQALPQQNFFAKHFGLQLLAFSCFLQLPVVVANDDDDLQGA